MQCMMRANTHCRYHVMGGGRKSHRGNASELWNRFGSSWWAGMRQVLINHV